MKRKQVLLLTQVIIIGVVFILFGLNIFVSLSKVLPYLLIPLIAANMFFLFLNETKGLFANVVLLVLTFLLFLFLIEYIATILGAVVSLYHGLRTGMVYVKKYVKVESK